MSFTKETLAHLWSKITNLIDTKLQKPKNDIALNTSSIGMSKKNLLKPVKTISETKNGITVTRNSDGSFVVNTVDEGATATDFFILGNIQLSANITYKLTGGYNGNCSLKFDNPNIFDTGNGLLYTPTADNADKIVLRVAQGTILDNITIYPMIRYADITDNTYEPYVDDLQTQIDNINNNSGVNSSGVGLVKKNLLCPGTTTTRAGVTYTVNYDGSVTLSGTNTSGTTYNYFSMPITLAAGKYKVSGMPSTSGLLTYRTDIRSSSTGGTVYGHGISEFEVEFTDTITVFYMIRIDGSYTESLDGITFYPMIRHANIVDSTYEPYVNDLLTQTMLNKSSIGMTTSKKNFLKTINPSSTLHGVKYTINSDGSILAKLTGEERTNTSYFVIDPSFNIPGDFVLTSNIPIAYGRLEIYNKNIGYVKQEHERPLYFTCDGITPIKVQVVLSPDAPITDGGFVIYPMITYKGVTNTKWEPYTEDLQTQIDTINNKITDTGWVTVNLATATSNLTFDTSISNWINYRKIGSIVYVRASMRFTSVSDENIVMTNMTEVLPDEFKPNLTGIVLGRCGTYTSSQNSDYQLMYWQFNPSGSVSIYATNNQKLSTMANKSITVNGSYFID